jgi:uncharacterized membrane protein YdjX (TVP38/TMEM64 family)
MELSNTGAENMVVEHCHTGLSTIPLKKIRVKHWIVFGSGLVGITLLWWYWQPALEFWHVASDREAVSAYLAQFGLVGPLLLSMVLVLQVIIAALPGEAFMISGGYVYGFGLALSISLGSTVVGSQVAFLLARWAGRPVVERLVPTDTLDRWRKTSDEKGLVFFLFAFMLPVFPGDLMSYVAGMSSLSGGRFFIANFFGRLPRVAVLSAIGAYGFDLSGWVWLLVLAIAAAMLIVWRTGASRTLGNSDKPRGIRPAELDALQGGYPRAPQSVLKSWTDLWRTGLAHWQADSVSKG